MMDDLRQKFDKVEQYVSSLAKNLAGNNKELETKLKEKIRNKVLQKETKSRKDDTTEFVEILKDKELEPDTETIVKAKETSLGIDEWTKNNIKTVRDVGGEVFKQTLIETTKTNNPNITEDQVKSVGELADLVNKIYNGDGGIENQKDVVFEQNKNESTEEVKHVWMDLRGRVGLLRQSPQELIKTEDDYQKTNNKLQGVSLPYQKMDKLASFDRIMNPSDNSEIRRLIDSARNKYKTITSYVFNKPVVKTEQGFASTINGQSASVFVKKSMDTLLHPGFVGGNENIARALNNNGKFEANNPSLVSGGLQKLVTNGSGFLKNSSGVMFNKLGNGVKKALGSGFDKLGGSLMRGLNALTSIPKPVSGLIKVKKFAPVIIGVIILILVMGIFDTNQVSTLVTGLKIEENDAGGGGGSGGSPCVSGSDGLTLKGPVKCSVADKTVATWQCASENAYTYFGGSECLTKVSHHRMSVCTSGCGVASTSIILQAHDPKYTPKYILENTGFKSHGNICNGVGWNMIKYTIEEVLGPEAIDYELDTDGDNEGVFQGCNEEWISKAICKGDVVMVLLKNPGHWVTAVAVLEDGNIALKDPGYGRAERQYNYLSNVLKQKDRAIRNCLAVKGEFINKNSVKDGTCGTGNIPKPGEITYTDDGRIRSCGVGMKVNFLTNRDKAWATPDLLASGNYNQQLEEFIGDQYGKRCGVVYAAQYLASDFSYFVPYYWNGKYYNKGIDPTWGKPKYDDNPKSSKYGTTHPWGLDCSGFIIWSQINGFGPGRSSGSSNSIAFSPKNCDAIKAIIEPGDTITLGSGSDGTYHIAMVLEYDDQYIKFGHSGGGSGSSTGLIDICTGKHRDSSMQFEYFHKKLY